MSRKRIGILLCLATVVCALHGGAAFAQAPTAQISGRVTDTSGGVLPGVNVTATQTDTGLVRSVVSNETGDDSHGGVCPHRSGAVDRGAHEQPARAARSPSRRSERLSAGPEKAQERDAYTSSPFMPGLATCTRSSTSSWRAAL
jgi:hypothetical protein